MRHNRTCPDNTFLADGCHDDRTDTNPTAPTYGYSLQVTGLESDRNIEIAKSMSTRTAKEMTIAGNQHIVLEINQPNATVST